MSGQERFLLWVLAVAHAAEGLLELIMKLFPA